MTYRPCCIAGGGGLLQLEWLQLFLAIGSITPDLVALVNGHINDVIRREAAREPTRDQLQGARLSERNLAIADGTDSANAPPPRGVQHKVVEAKKLRKEYAKKKLEFLTAEQDWWRGRGRQYSDREWRRWKQHLQDLLHYSIRPWCVLSIAHPPTVVVSIPR